MFILGFQQEFLDWVAHRLQLMNPDADPEEGFLMKDIYNMALAILRGSTFFCVKPAVPSVRLDKPLVPSVPLVHPAPASPAQLMTIVKHKDIYAMLGQTQYYSHSPTTCIQLGICSSHTSIPATSTLPAPTAPTQ